MAQNREEESSSAFSFWDETPDKKIHKGGARSGCQNCHTPYGWLPVYYASHDGFSFALVGKHREAPCKGCHQASLFEPILNKQCNGCHEDAHAGRLGIFCDACHQPSDWNGQFATEGHSRSAFPLLGAHGLIPCQECHQSPQGRFNAAIKSTCISCHAEAFAATAARTVDHGASGYSTMCQSCHYTWSFRPALYKQHEGCFPILSGAHRSVACQSCHSNLAGTVASGSCGGGGMSFSCTECHAHDPQSTDLIHSSVAGYTYQSASCVSCHPNGRGP